MKVLFGALMAFILPLRWTSRLYLEQQLRAEGIDSARISKACLQELTDDVIRHAKIDAKLFHKNVRAAVVEFMDVQAGQVATVIEESAAGKSWTTELRRGSLDTEKHVREILHKHRVV
jgi:hypothetical protein